MCCEAREKGKLPLNRLFLEGRNRNKKKIGKCKVFGLMENSECKKIKKNKQNYIRNGMRYEKKKKSLSQKKKNIPSYSLLKKKKPTLITIRIIYINPKIRTVHTNCKKNMKKNEKKKCITVKFVCFFFILLVLLFFCFSCSTKS